jgi:hypothetical protein
LVSCDISILACLTHPCIADVDAVLNAGLNVTAEVSPLWLQVIADVEVAVDLLTVIDATALLTISATEKTQIELIVAQIYAVRIYSSPRTRIMTKARAGHPRLDRRLHRGAAVAARQAVRSAGREPAGAACDLREAQHLALRHRLAVSDS